MPHTTQVLIDALQYCKHKAESMRMWTGQGWHYNPPMAKSIFEKAEAALAAVKAEQEANFEQSELVGVLRKFAVDTALNLSSEHLRVISRVIVTIQYMQDKLKSLASAKQEVPEHIHSCGYHCDRPACIKDQLDELVQK